jgi:6,7-dimethyl-8-ribityllumazine synthase
MLRKNQISRVRAKGHRFAVVASRYNREYVDVMLRAAVRALKAAGAASVKVVRVPGAYEIPLAAQALAAEGESRPVAIICLGVILRGETTHAQFIGEAVSQGLMRIQLDNAVPVIHEVLLLENREQARVRCLDQRHNRGAEAAQTALEMAGVMTSLRSAGVR